MTLNIFIQLQHCEQFSLAYDFQELEELGDDEEELSGSEEEERGGETNCTMYLILFKLFTDKQESEEGEDEEESEEESEEGEEKYETKNCSIPNLIR